MTETAPDPQGSCVGVYVGVGVGGVGVLFGFCQFHATTRIRCRELPLFNFNRLDVYGCAFKLAVALDETAQARELLERIVTKLSSDR